jgi:hypothetical protein
MCIKKRKKSEEKYVWEKKKYMYEFIKINKVNSPVL